MANEYSEVASLSREKPRTLVQFMHFTPPLPTPEFPRELSYHRFSSTDTFETSFIAMEEVNTVNDRSAAMNPFTKQPLSDAGAAADPSINTCVASPSHVQTTDPLYVKNTFLATADLPSLPTDDDHRLRTESCDAVLEGSRTHKLSLVYPTTIHETSIEGETEEDFDHSGAYIGLGVPEATLEAVPKEETTAAAAKVETETVTAIRMHSQQDRFAQSKGQERLSHPPSSCDTNDMTTGAAAAESYGSLNEGAVNNTALHEAVDPGSAAIRLKATTPVTTETAFGVLPTTLSRRDTVATGTAVAGTLTTTEALLTAQATPLPFSAETTATPTMYSIATPSPPSQETVTTLASLEKAMTLSLKTRPSSNEVFPSPTKAEAVKSQGGKGHTVSGGRGRRQSTRVGRGHHKVTAGGSRRRTSQAHSAKDSEIQQHDDDVGGETTIMLRNIPNKYTQKMLLDVLNEEFRGLYDFFYLPIDFRNKCNVGYAFINFIHSHYAQMFKSQFDGLKLGAFKSNKVCEVSWGRVQGLQANIDHYRNSAVMSIPNPQYKPILFRNGVAVPFPVADGPLPSVKLRPQKC